MWIRWPNFDDFLGGSLLKSLPELRFQVERQLREVPLSSAETDEVPVAGAGLVGALYPDHPFLLNLLEREQPKSFLTSNGFETTRFEHECALCYCSKSALLDRFQDRQANPASGIPPHGLSMSVTLHRAGNLPEPTSPPKVPELLELTRQLAMKVPEFLEVTSQFAITESVFLALHYDIVEEVGSKIGMFNWIGLVLAATENEVRPEADRFLANLQNDHKAWQKVFDSLGELQKAILHDSLGHGDSLRQYEISRRIQNAVKKLESSLNSREKDLLAILSRVAKLSGSRIPPMPPKLVRPSRLTPIIDALQRALSGYA